MNKQYEDFAKIFRFESVGQVLFTLDTDDDDFPEINVRIASRHGLVPEIRMSGWSKDVDECWDIAEKKFVSIDQDEALRIATEIANTVDDMMKNSSLP
jgi:hypothetical protein